MRALAVGLTAAILLLTPSCTPQPDPPSTLVWGDCPADVEATFLARHQCGTLTVPVNRSRPDGPTLDLLVARAWPVGQEPREGIGTGFGHNIGDPQAVSGGMAAGRPGWEGSA